MVQYKNILVPFNALPLSPSLFNPALTVARENSANLVLLRLGAGNGKAAEDDGERLYTELKALQAQLRRRGVNATIEAAPGVSEETLPAYAAAHDVDLILVGIKERSLLPNMRDGDGYVTLFVPDEEQIEA